MVTGMTGNRSLIEKLRAELRPWDVPFNQGLLAAIAIVSDHIPESGKMVASYTPDDCLREDLHQIIRVALTNPGDLRGFIQANYPKDYALHAQQRPMPDPARTESPDVVERVAIALSMADPDERGLPDGVGMEEFYRDMAKAAIAAMGRSELSDNREHKSGCDIQFDGPCNCKEEPFKCAGCGAISTNGEKPCNCATMCGFRESDMTKCVFKDKITEQPDGCRAAFEATIKAIYGDEYVDLDRDETGEYISLIPEVSYKVWLAAREPVRKTKPDPMVDNLAMLCRRLAHRLSKQPEGRGLAGQAMKFLIKHGLQGSPLRDDDEQGRRGPSTTEETTHGKE